MFKFAVIQTEQGYAVTRFGHVSRDGFESESSAQAWIRECVSTERQADADEIRYIRE